MDTSEPRDIYIAIPNGDGNVDLYPTAIRGFIDSDGDFIIPYQNDMTAEEIGRIITKGIRQADDDARY